MKLQIPCAYQGGKQRIAKDIVDVLLNEQIDENTIFYDLCCGSGAISIELVNRGISPNRIVMLDKSPWGLFWKMIGDGTFDINRFSELINDIPKDVGEIQGHIKTLSAQYADADTPYVYLLLQASSFGSKSIWIENNKWMNTSFRSYWLPTETSSRRSPVNPMMPMPNTLLKRVQDISNKMVGITGIYDDIYSVNYIANNSIVYIDPPYSGTTGYGHSFDLNAFIRTMNKKCFVSESRRLTDNAVLISIGRSKGGISGDREGTNKEWLNVFE